MKFGAALLMAISMLGAGASAAGAADSLYWANYNTPTISVANLDGSGSGRDLFTGAQPRGGTVDLPAGLTLDPSAGMAYWANSGGTVSITRGSLDSCDSSATCATNLYPLGVGGPPVAGPGGPALDAANGVMYWMNSTGVLVRASLDGSGAVNGTVDTTGATALGGGGSGGLAIDKRTNRIYWTNDDFSTGKISWANLDGSGGGDLNTTGAVGGRPWGIALDTVSNRVYWTYYEGSDGNKGAVSWANLDGSGGGNLYTSASPGCSMLDGANGVAVDAAANKIYWANFGGSSLASANLDGSGGCADVSSTGATMAGPDEVAVLKTPVATSAATLSGKPVSGQTLSCNGGTWGSDTPEANVYRAPRSTAYQWKKDGAPIAGATGATYTPTTAGVYDCAATATNNAGTTTGQATASLAVKHSVRFVKPKLKVKRKGGKLLVSGKVSPGASPSLAKSECKGTVSLKLTLKKKKLASKRFALKYKSGKCSAAVSLKVAKKYSRKKVKLKLSVGSSSTLTAAAKTFSVRL